MRWTLAVTGMALTLATLGGCKQQLFLTEPDYRHYKEMGEKLLEYDPSASIIPSTTDMAPPTTIFDTDRKVRYVSLPEAIASALEKGTTGVQSPFFPGAITDLLGTFSGRTLVGSDSVRVLALQPGIIANDIEAALSKFDARWISQATWQTTDQPVGTALQTFQAAAGGGFIPTINQNNATISSTFLKPLATGGVAGITFNTNYNQSNLQQRVNPAYQPNFSFSFEQPLLQGFGTEINQLRAAHPGSLLNPYPNQARVEGVLITRLRFDEQRAEFERNINFTLQNVEIAYWNLYGSYWTLYSREQALRQAFEAWKINKLRFDSGRIPIMDYAQSRQQYELFRAQRISALGDVLEKERQLRGFMGLPIEDGTRLVPSDEPKLAPYMPDWHTAVNEALALRPELVIARNDLKFRQLDLITQKNQLMPDLRFTSTYGWNGLGSRLDGGPNNPNNAFASLSSGNFVNWTAGVQMNMPIGFRDANAAVRSARLALAQAYAVLQDQENKATRYLAFQYRKLFTDYELIRANRAQRLAAAEQLEARFREFLAGRGTLDILLEAQRVWADALKAEYDNIVAYNSTLASFEFAKGTIMPYDNVMISEGPLPQAVAQRAVENERSRSRALELRQHPPERPLTQRTYGIGTPELPGVYTNTSQTPVNLLETPPTLMDALPDLYTPIPEINEPVKPVRQVNMPPMSPPAHGGAMVPVTPATVPAMPVSTIKAPPPVNSTPSIPPAAPLGTPTSSTPAELPDLYSMPSPVTPNK